MDGKKIEVFNKSDHNHLKTIKIKKGFLYNLVQNPYSNNEIYFSKGINDLKSNLFIKLNYEGNVIGGIGLNNSLKIKNASYDIQNIKYLRFDNKFNYYLMNSIFFNNIQKYDKNNKLINEFKFKIPFNYTADSRKSLNTIIGNGIDIDKDNNVYIVHINRYKNSDEIKASEIRMVGSKNTLPVTKYSKFKPESYKTDLHTMKIFDENAKLINEIPLNVYCDAIRIIDNK